MHTATLFSDRVMRATTFALTFALMVLVTGVASAFFATTLTANALGALPRVQAAPFVQMAANNPLSSDANLPIAR
jgi:hypothetical protein